MIDILSSGGVKTYVTLYNGCSIGSEVTIKPGGIIHFDLEHAVGSRCQLLVKRNSGHGELIIKNAGQEINQQISSKIGQEVELLIEDKLLEFYCPKDKNIGTVSICKFLLFKDNEMKNWKEILAKCGEYKLLRVVDGKLLAAEGASILAINILSLNTQPAEAYVKTGEIYKFPIPCEILNIETTGNTTMPANPMFVHMESPPPVLTLADVDGSDDLNIPAYTPPPYSAPVPIRANVKEAGFVYNSSHNDGLAPFKLLRAKEVQKRGEAIVLNRNSFFSIPIASIEPETDYILAIQGRKLNGNGKLGIAIETSSGDIRSSTMMIHLFNQKEICVNLFSGVAPTPGDTYCIRVFRPENAIGEVCLTKLSVTHGFSRQKITRDIILPEADIQSINEATLEQLVLDNKKVSDSVAYYAKKYSREHWKKYVSLIDFSANIGISSISALKWYTKIYGVSENCNLVSNSSILIGDVSGIKSAKNIWLDAFDETQELLDSTRQNLSAAELIATPSESNHAYLTNRYKNAKVFILERSWPMLPEIGTEFSFPYAVLFHRETEFTNKIIELWPWQDGSIKLVVFGARGNFPEYVWPTHEYLPYKKLFNIISNAKFGIDMPLNYLSGVQSLMRSLRLPFLAQSEISQEQIKEQLLLGAKINIDLEHNNKIKTFLDTIASENSQS